MLTDYHVHLRPDEPRSAAADDYFTAENVDRYLAAAGGGRDRGARRLGARLPLPAGARRVGPPVLGRARPRRPRRLLRVRSRRPRCGSASRWTTSRAARIASPTCSTPRLRLRARVGPLRRATGPWTTRSGTSGSRSAIRTGVEAYFETLAEAAGSGLFDVLAHPDLVKVWGARPPGARARPALLLRARRRGDRREPGSRSRSRPRGCGSRWGRSTRRPDSRRCAWRPGPRSPVLGRPRARRRRLRLRAALEAMTSWGIEEIAVFEGRERRLEPLGRRESAARSSPR